MRSSARTGISFNIIDGKRGEKADLSPLTRDSRYRHAFGRRIRLQIKWADEEPFEAWCARPDDVIYGKFLAWDDLWSVLAVSAYLKETGDLAFLNEIIPYYEKDRNEQPVESGTASRMYRAATQYILGLQPTYSGLKVAPVIPENWPGFTATRIYRGVTYRITVRRAGPGNSVALRVDGQPVSGNIIPPPAAGRAEVQVEAVMG